MTKTLTEQWRDWELQNGLYYIKDWDGTTRRFVAQNKILWRDDNNPIYVSENIEVLEAVPSYDEYEDILQQNVNQESAIEIYIEEIKRLQEQLNEANETIKKAHELCPDKNTVLMCNPPRPSFGMMTDGVLTKYLEKWGMYNG